MIGKLFKKKRNTMRVEIEFTTMTTIPCEVCGKIHDYENKELVKDIKKSQRYRGIISPGGGCVFEYEKQRKKELLAMNDNELIKNFKNELNLKCDLCNNWSVNLWDNCLISSKVKDQINKLAKDKNMDGEHRIKLFVLLKHLHEKSEIKKQRKDNKAVDALIKKFKGDDLFD